MMPTGVFRNCPKCSCEVHIRKTTCQCGKVSRKAISRSSTEKRDEEKHRNCFRDYAAKKKALENADQVDKRKECNRACAARKRALGRAD